MKKIKILYISGTRADYGLMKKTLFSIKNNPNLELEIIVTGMHLMSEFGMTINELKEDGFKIHVANAVYGKDKKESSALFLGKLVTILVGKISKIKPDIILVLGDRAEMLAGAIVGVYMALPVAHIHGGDVSLTADEFVRHAITKLSCIHFAATKKSAERIIKMGEEKQRVYIVGTPGFDDIIEHRMLSLEEVVKKYNLNLSKPIILVVQHPVTTEMHLAGAQMRETMLAVQELGYQTIVIYPNADAGGREIIKAIKEYKGFSYMRIYQNIPRKDYLGLLKVADAMVGNSSSGIIEAPSFHLPAVNVGIRQFGRERAGNVIDVKHKKNDIKKAIKKALYDNKFRNKKYKNPYENKSKTGHKIAKILGSIALDSKLLQKKLSY